LDNIGFAFNLGELGRYYKGYETLMAHWRAVLPEGVMLEVRYEALVEDFEQEARRIVAYCGLDWAGRWRLYEEHLGHLVEALRDDRLGR
jgi:hypothetical protein